MSQSESLKPCPFCGGKADTMMYHTPPRWSVGCIGCAAQFVGPETEEEAIAAWNRRPSTADRGGDVEVKALEWESIDSSCMWANVREFWLQYRITLRADGMKVLRREWMSNRTEEGGIFNEWDAAKAAAQADYTARIRSALATTAGEAKWFAASVPPSIPVGTQRSFIVAVRRAHSGKVYSFPAIYLNGYQLVYETGECPKGNGCEGNGCDDGCPTTGWYSDSSEGEYDHNYAKLALAPGDEFLAWSPIQQFDPDRVALVTDKG